VARYIASALLALLLSLSGLTVSASPKAPALAVQDFEHDGRRYAVRLPAGYRLELLSSRLDGPRLLSFSDNGDLFIGSRSGAVYRLPPPYRTPQVLVRLDGYPHSVAFRSGEILIARTGGLYRAAYEAGQARVERGALERLAALPGGGGHNSRSVAVGPDDRVYVSLGISGNCSDQYLHPSYPFDDRRGGVLVLDESGDKPQWRPFAAGLRNPVGFDWHPETGVLYASNNGPDHHGYDQPPEYFSRLEAGSFHGMPWFQFDGSRIRPDDCIERTPPRPRGEVTPPVATFPARSAPMGVAFVPEDGLDPDLALDAVVALHGSWGTRPHGGFRGDPATRRPPKLMVVRFEDGEAQRVEDLVTGFQLEDGERWARPVGVAIGPDGALYFTSDSGINGLFRLRPDR
jgi:glucose/arabinose dehydrogenase